MHIEDESEYKENKHFTTTSLLGNTTKYVYVVSIAYEYNKLSLQKFLLCSRHNMCPI